MAPLKGYTFKRFRGSVYWRLRWACEGLASGLVYFLGIDKAVADAHRRRTGRELAAFGKDSLIRQPTVIEIPWRVSIGEHVTIGAFVHMWGNAGIEIGDRTMIASHVAITTATHDPDAAHMNETMIELPVKIGNDVWIGTHAVIFPGVTIGEHAMIAAGAIVRDDVPPYTIVAGMPAAVVRQKTAALAARSA